MSYDLMVFAPEAAPAKRADFLAWYERQTEWEEAHDYDDPAVATPALRDFYMAMLPDFPAAADDGDAGQGGSDEATGTDYMIGASLIYMSFPWDKVDQAFDAVMRLAAKHRLGFFDLSSDLAEVWLPDGKGGLEVAHSD